MSWKPSVLCLAPFAGEPQTLEQKLNALTDTQKLSLLQTAKLIQIAMTMKIAAGDYSMGYAELLESNVRQDAYCQEAVDCRTFG